MKQTIKLELPCGKMYLYSDGNACLESYKSHARSDHFQWKWDAESQELLFREDEWASMYQNGGQRGYHSSQWQPMLNATEQYLRLMNEMTVGIEHDPRERRVSFFFPDW